MRKKSLSAIGLSILGALLVVLVVVTVAAGFEVEAPKTSHDSALTVIATGLDSPRHLTFGPDGALYVAEAGVGGEGPECVPGPEGGESCLGDSGAITRITTTTPIAQQRVVTGLDSLAGEESPGGTVDAIGPHDILFDVTNGIMEAGGSHDFQFNSIGSMHVLFGLGGTPTNTVTPTGVLSDTSLAWITKENVPGTLDNLVDIGAFELAENPDGGELDTNPFAFVRDDSDGTIYVADAGGNSVLSVASGTLNITTTAVFSDRLVSFFADFPTNTIPISIPMQAVPTSIDIGSGGDLFVGQLTGFPFPVGGANVYKIPAGGGDPEVYKSGFTAIVDIEFDSSGNLYVLEMAKNGLLAGFGLGDWTGAVKRIDPMGGVTTVAGSEELEAPTGLTIGPDGALYISNKGIFPGEGEVVRIEPQARLRVAHLAPFTDTLEGTAVDVKIDGEPALTAFQYLSSTTYFTTTAGEHQVQVFLTGGSTPVISETVDLANYVDYSAFAIGGANGYDLMLKPEVDDNGTPAMGNGKVRLGHLAPFAFPESATEAEILTDDGSAVFGPFEYRDIDDYIELPAGFYDLRVVTTADDQTIIELFPFELKDGDILYAVAVGDGTNQAPGVFAYPTDVEGFLLPEEVNTYFPIVFKQ
jgi:hypothetical protein